MQNMHKNMQNNMHDFSSVPRGWSLGAATVTVTVTDVTPAPARGPGPGQQTTT